MQKYKVGIYKKGKLVDTFYETRTKPKLERRLESFQSRPHNKKAGVTYKIISSKPAVKKKKSGWDDFW